MPIARRHLYRLCWAACWAALLLPGCATDPVTARLAALPPAELIVLGEQHDAPAHQRIHASAVQTLAGRGQLAALALEMAPAGRSTASLPRDADAAAVRAALDWNDQAWPWERYAAAVLAAVRAGVPVLGANLPRSAMRGAMADTTLDALLPPAAWQAQQEAIRAGHCDLLPAAQIVPMARIQLARDRAMARVVEQAVRPGRSVLLLTGAGHADRTLGVPRHLPATLRVHAVRLQAGGQARPSPGFDAIWTTPPAPPRDHCAELRQHLRG